jgi:hypothetical protein
MTTKKMTVAALREILAALPDDLEVALESNDLQVTSEVTGTRYDPDGDVPRFYLLGWL